MGIFLKVTLKDIAKRADVSTSAVSLVLNNKPCRISQIKQEEIRSIAKELNYIPNQLARSLVAKETKTLGVIIPDIENLFFSSYVKNLESYCREKGYFLLIASSNNLFSMDMQLIEMFTARAVDGLFLTISDESYDHEEELVAALKNLSYTYVMVDRIFENFKCNQVTYDNEKGALKATEYLLTYGHKNIGCVTANSSYGNGKKRLSGYKKALSASGIPFDEKLVFEGMYDVESGYRAANIFRDKTTAAFVSSDMMTLGFLKFLEEHTYRIPEDYSVVSYDNVSAPYLYHINLTAISQNVTMLAHKAIDLLLEQLKKSTSPKTRSIVLEPRLEKGNTVGLLRMQG